MPIESADSVFEKSVERLRLMVAESAKFQEITSSANKTEALDHVFYPDVIDGYVATAPPRAIVDDIEGSYVFKIAGLDTKLYERSMNLVLELIVPDADVNDVADHLRLYAQRRYAMNRFDTIRDEMMALSGVGESVVGETHLFLDSITHEAGPFQMAPEEYEHDSDTTIDGHYAIIYRVELGN